MTPRRTPSKELLFSANLVNGLKREQGFIFTYKGQEIDLSSCEGEKPVHILSCIANQLADRLHKDYCNKLEELFGDRL